MQKKTLIYYVLNSNRWLKRMFNYLLQKLDGSDLFLIKMEKYCVIHHNAMICRYE